MRLIAKTILSLLILTGCSDAKESSSPSVHAAEQTVLKETEAPVVAASPRASSAFSPLQATTTGLLGNLAPSERKVVTDFYSSYGNLFFSFSGPEQLQWLAANHYPLPTDVLEAAQASDDELLGRYRQGDIKAGFFYLNRITGELASGVSDERRARELDQIAREYLTVGSPLAGFAYYHYQAVGRKDPHAAYAGLALAGDFGDDRAMLQMLDQAARQGASVDAIRLLSAYKLINSAIRSRRPELLVRRWPPLPAATRPNDL